MRNYGSIEDNKFDSVVPEVDDEQQITYQSSSSPVIFRSEKFSWISFLCWLILAVPIFLVEIHPSNLDVNLTIFSGATTRQAANPQCTFSQVSLRNSSIYVLPSEYEACIRRIVLNVNHTIQTIRALDQIYQQEYVFYSIARDPGFLIPKDPAGNLNNTIYDIRVDIHNSLQAIERKIKASNKADASIFWDVNEVFRSLRDAHVAALQGNLGGLSSDFFSGRYTLEILPEKWLLGEKEGRLRVGFLYQNNAELKLVIEWLESNNTDIRTRTVSRIDGVTAFDFMLRLAGSFMMSTNMKSIGPRINALAAFHFPTNFEGDHAFFWTGRGERKERVSPSKIAQDFFWIEFEDNTREKFVARVVVQDDEWKGLRGTQEGNVFILELSEVQRLINEPSCLFRNFLSGTQKLNESAAYKEKSPRRRLQFNNASTLIGRRASQGMNVLHDCCDVSTGSRGWFTRTFNCSGFSVPYNDDGPLEAAYRVMDGYMLF
jgi:hypothetical protein